MNIRPQSLSSALILTAAAAVAFGTFYFASLRPGYSHIANTISELGETGAPHARLVAYGFFLPVGLIVWLALWLIQRGRPDKEVSAILLALSCLGTGYVMSAFAPCDPGGPLFGSWRTRVHNLAGLIDYGGTGVGFLLVARRHRKNAAANQAAGFVVAGASCLVCLVLLLPVVHIRGGVQRVVEVIQFTGVFFACLVLSKQFEKEQSHKSSLTAALLSALIRIVFLPVWLVVIIPYTVHMILSSRRLGVSATALSPMTMRWLQHQLKLRRDEACAKLIEVLPNHFYIGLCVTSFPVLLSHRLTGFVPKMLRYPYEGIPPVRHASSVRATFVDAAIERYLPGVEQFVELGAGYDTRTVQLQHNRRIRCFEVDLPKTQQMKRELLDQCGVDTSGVKFVSANFLTDNWLGNLVKAGFDPGKPTFFLWEGVTYYLSREAMEKTFRTIATMAPGSVVVFDYATEAVLKLRRKPLGLLAEGFLKAVREPQTFWISSEPPVKKNLAALMDAYGLSLREHLNYGGETKRKRSFGGLATAVVLKEISPPV